MKRFLTIFLVLAFASSAFGGQFGWTLSDSNTDPMSNQGTFTAAGLLTLYLWYYCTNNDRGLASAEFDIASSNPVNIIAAFTAINPPWLNAGGATNLLLAVGGCPSGLSVAGSFLISANGPGQYCLTTSAIGNNVSVNCVDLNTYDNDWIGYSTDGTAPCTSPETLCFIVAVENTSWGSVKSLYR
jgi:hypothetical protein